MFKPLFASLVIALGLAILPSTALAASPNLTANYNAGSFTLTFTVTGANAYSQVNLYTRQQGSSLYSVISNIGITDQSGYFSGSLNSNTGGSNSGFTDAYVVVNGQQSNTVALSGSGCTYNCGTGGISFSQNSLTLSSGQSANVSIFGLNGGSFYISSNTNSASVSASVSGSTLNLFANNSGNATISVCGSFGSQCGSVYATVSGTGGSGQISLSQTNLNISIGQNVNLSISGGNNSYYLATNSNPAIASASLSGNTLSIIGQSNGSSTISVCSTFANSACASVLATVAGGTSFGLISFSPPGASLGMGQNLAVTVYGPTGSLYVFSNSNSNVVSTSLSGNSLNLFGSNVGAGTVVVCSSQSSRCGSLPVTVTSGGGSQISFSQNNLTLNPAQSYTVTVFGGSAGNYYLSGNSNNTVAVANLSGNSLNLYANNVGSTTFTVCSSAGSFACGTLAVYVAGSGTTVNLSLAQTTANLNVGQSLAVNVYGPGASSLYVANNSNPGAVTAALAVSGSLNLSAIAPGIATVTVCTTFGSQCGSVAVNVGAGGGGLSFANSVLPQPVVNQYYSSQLQVSGGVSPYTYTIISGGLPVGLTLSNQGLINGTSTSTISANFTVQVADNFNNKAYQNFILQPTAFGSVSYTPNPPNPGPGLQYPGNSGSVLGASRLNNGVLISDGRTIYQVYHNKKSGFVSMAVFRGFDFKLNNVLYGTAEGVADTGYVINSAQTSHPWGAWVKSGQTVYFMHELGLIPIAGYDVFLNNGGDAALVVNANSFDFRLPLLSAMTLNDPRL